VLHRKYYVIQTSLLAYRDGKGIRTARAPRVTPLSPETFMGKGSISTAFCSPLHSGYTILRYRIFGKSKAPFQGNSFPAGILRHNFMISVESLAGDHGYRHGRSSWQNCMGRRPDMHLTATILSSFQNFKTEFKSQSSSIFCLLHSNNINIA